jgi:NAD-dependent SIR2 family protein deacetylase
MPFGYPVFQSTIATCEKCGRGFEIYHHRVPDEKERSQITLCPYCQRGCPPGIIKDREQGDK